METSNGTVGRRPKVRELMRDLIDRGFERVRQNGSHAIYRHGDGRTFPLPVHARVGEEVTQAVMLTYRRVVIRGVTP